MIPKYGFVGSAVSGIIRGGLNLGGKGAKRAIKTVTDKRIVDHMMGGSARLGKFIDTGAYRKGYAAAARAQQAGGMSRTEMMSRMARAQRIMSGHQEVISKVVPEAAGGIARGVRGAHVPPGVKPMLKLGRWSALNAAKGMTAGGMKGHAVRAGIVGAGFGVGGLVGLGRGARAMHGVGPAPRQSSSHVYGPGYFTWAKASGGGMPANHGSTQGLSLAMHRARRR
jgi:hypothetical protein